jgi:hypothetical protein
MLKKAFLICFTALVVAIGASMIFGGLRLVAIAPTGNQAGKTVIATGLGDLSPLDSPQAYCRRQGDEDPTCPMSFQLAIAREGVVIVELPYIEMLHTAAGAL